MITRHGIRVFHPTCNVGLQVFDFDAIKAFLARPDFKVTYDAMFAITAAYAKPLFVDELGAKEDILRGCVPMDDFNGGHPDPNLTCAFVSPRLPCTPPAE
jgi:phosphoglucomutase